MKLVGITGRKYHGKDTVARELVLNGFSIVRFAGPLKDMMRAFYRAHDINEAVIERKIEGDLKEHPCPLLRGKTPRYAMQTLGDEWGRQLISADLWTESLAYRLLASSDWARHLSHERSIHHAITLPATVPATQAASLAKRRQSVSASGCGRTGGISFEVGWHHRP